MRHLPYEEKPQWLGLHSLQRRRLRTDLITALKIFMGRLDIDLNLFFLPPTPHVLRGHPFKVRATFDGEDRLFRWGCSRRYNFFCQYFQDDFEESLDRRLSPSPPLTEH